MEDRKDSISRRQARQHRVGTLYGSWHRKEYFSDEENDRDTFAVYTWIQLSPSKAHHNQVRCLIMGGFATEEGAKKAAQNLNDSEVEDEFHAFLDAKMGGTPRFEFERCGAEWWAEAPLDLVALETHIRLFEKQKKEICQEMDELIDCYKSRAQKMKEEEDEGELGEYHSGLDESLNYEGRVQ